MFDKIDKITVQLNPSEKLHGHSEWPWISVVGYVDENGIHDYPQPFLPNLASFVRTFKEKVESTCSGNSSHK